MTRDGIEKNIKISPYILNYDFLKLTIKFSSNFYMLKFIEKINEQIELDKLKFNKFTKIKINHELFSIINLYQKIEKRGFYIIFNNIEYNSFNDLEFIMRLKYEKKS